jgi:hypothetical protein
LKDIAAKFEFPFVDQYAITRAAQDKMLVDDPKAEKAKPYPDGFHTAPPGGMLMAHAILTGLKSPALVSDVSFDAASKKVTGKNCTVTVVDGAAISFERKDEALPWAVQKDWLPMLPYTNELKDLNWYGLQVTGLKEGSYAVKIDGVEVAKFSGEELAKGVNLGNLTAGPIWDHADKVYKAIEAKNRIVAGRFRGVILANVPEWLADVAKERKPMELEKRLAQIVEAQKAVNELVKPKSHKWEVVAVK